MLGAARRPALIAAQVIAIACAAGCSGSTPASCPNDFPAACPDAAPSFAADVAPLIHSRCTPCHGPGQQVPTLDSYAQIATTMTVMAISMQVYQCKMPPPPRAALTAGERQTVLGWIVCGAPNN